MPSDPEAADEDLLSSSESLALDSVFELLAHSYRRYTVASLPELGSLALANVGEEFGVREQGSPVHELPEEDSKQIDIDLWHLHVPKSATEDVVENLHDRNLVALGDNVDLVDRSRALTQKRINQGNLMT